MVRLPGLTDGLEGRLVEPVVGLDAGFADGRAGLASCLAWPLGEPVAPVMRLVVGLVDGLVGPVVATEFLQVPACAAHEVVHDLSAEKHVVHVVQGMYPRRSCENEEHRLEEAYG